MLRKSILLLLLASSLSACAGIKKAPEPDMKHLVPVNQDLPPELRGHVPPDLNAPQGSRAGNV